MKRPASTYFHGASPPRRQLARWPTHASRQPRAPSQCLPRKDGNIARYDFRPHVYASNAQVLGFSRRAHLLRRAGPRPPRKPQLAALRRISIGRCRARGFAAAPSDCRLSMHFALRHAAVSIRRMSDLTDVIRHMFIRHAHTQYAEAFTAAPRMARRRC